MKVRSTGPERHEGHVCKRPHLVATHRGRRGWSAHTRAEAIANWHYLHGGKS